MSKSRHLILLLLTVIAISGCGTGRSKAADSGRRSVKITEGLERYIGGTLDELSALLEEEPVLEEKEYSEENDGGYPTKVSFAFEKSGISGTLQVGYILASMTGDATLHIEEITAWLPYENEPGIEKNDDMETVKKKIREAGFGVDSDDEFIISYTEGQLKYTIFMSMIGNKAGQISISQIRDGEYREGQFEAYCAAVPNGYYLENGDYMFVNERGLIQLYKDYAAVSVSPAYASGKLEETEDGLRFTAPDGKIYFISSNGVPVPAELASSEDTPQTGEAPRNNRSDGEGNPLLARYKEMVKTYQQYALERWGYDANVFYDVADFNNDGILEMYTIVNKSSPTPGTTRWSEMTVYTLQDREVKYLSSYTAYEPMLQGGTDFYNYYLGSIPGEGDFLILQ